MFPNLGIVLENVGKNISIGNFTIAYYGIIIALGMVIGVSYILREAKRLGLDEDKYLNICMITIVLSVLGARVYYVAFSWEDYKGDFLAMINIRQGGLAIYGGVITGIIVAAVLSRVYKEKLMLMLDIFVPGLLIGQFMGRWGNFFNREAFGQYTDGLFAMALPVNAVRSVDITSEMMEHAYVIDGVQFIQVHPTFLYESAWNVCLFVIIFCLRKHKRFDGQLFAMYALGYGLGRFMIESLRTDQLLLWNTGIAVSQVVACGMMAFGIVYIVLNEILIHRRKQAAVEQQG